MHSDVRLRLTHIVHSQKNNKEVEIPKFWKCAKMWVPVSLLSCQIHWARKKRSSSRQSERKRIPLKGITTLLFNLLAKPILRSYSCDPLCNELIVSKLRKPQHSQQHWLLLIMLFAVCVILTLNIASFKIPSSTNVFCTPYPILCGW